MQFKLTARCPKCGAPVRLRNTTKAMELLRIARAEGFDSDAALQTYQCARRLSGGLCNTIVTIRLSDWVPREVG